MNLASHTLSKPIFVGGLAWLGLRYGLGEPDTPSSFFGLQVDNSIALAGSFAISSAASETIKNYVMPYLPGSVLENQNLVSALQPLITGAAGVIVHGLGSDLSSNYSDLFKVGGIGALSEVGVQMIEQKMSPSAAQH